MYGVPPNEQLGDLHAGLCGDAALAAQHRGLREIVEALRRRADESARREATNSLLVCFNQALREHVECEERWLDGWAYSPFLMARHLATHEAILERLVELDFELMRHPGRHTAASLADMLAALLDTELACDTRY